MNRRELLQLSVLGAAGAASAQEKQKKETEAPAPFDYAGKSIKALQAEMKDGKLSSAQLTQAYLQRIEQVKPLLHAVLEVNPDALPMAEALDKERRETKNGRSAMHGIPVLLKDNIETGDKM